MTLMTSQDFALTGCFTDESDAAARGIMLYDTSAPAWTLLQTIATPNPSWLVCHPNGSHVYAVNEVDEHDGVPTGALQVYRIDLDDDTDHPVLRHVATRVLAPGATGPTHVATDPQGRHLVVSSYNGGQFNVFALDAHGMPGEVTHAERPVGHGLDPDRQEAPHAHHATCAPSGDLWLTCDLGRDHVSMMRLEQSRLVHTGEITVTPGAGARHAVFHPVQPWIYVITEMHATLVRLTYDPHAGTLQYPDANNEAQTYATHAAQDHDALLDEPLFDGQLFEGGLLNAEQQGGDVPLLPDGYTGEKSGAALVIHASGRWLFASTRRTSSTHPYADSVTAWAIDPESGTLSLIGRYATGLDFPRTLALSPEGDTLFALNQKGNSIIAMKVTPDTGALEAPQVVATTTQPTCLAWIQAARAAAGS